MRGPTTAAHTLCSASLLPHLEYNQGDTPPSAAWLSETTPCLHLRPRTPPFLPRKKAAPRSLCGRLGFHDNGLQALADAGRRLTPLQEYTGCPETATPTLPLGMPSPSPTRPHNHSGSFYPSAPCGLSSHSVACSFGSSNLHSVFPWRRREVG